MHRSHRSNDIIGYLGPSRFSHLKGRQGCVLVGQTATTDDDFTSVFDPGMGLQQGTGGLAHPDAQHRRMPVPTQHSVNDDRLGEARIAREEPVPRPLHRSNAALGPGINLMWRKASSNRAVRPEQNPLEGKYA